MSSSGPTYGLVIDDPGRPLRRKADVRVDLVCLRDTFREPPRRAGASRRADRLRESLGPVEIVPYVWQLVTHGAQERGRDAQQRTLEGDPHAFGSLQDTPEVARAWEATRSAAEGFGAQRLILHTAPSTAPGAVGRQRLTRFVERMRADGLECVWEPSGLWEPDTAEGAASALSVPLLWASGKTGRWAEDAPEAAWRIIDASRGSPDPDLVDELLDAPDAAPVLLFRGDRAMAHLTAVQRALG